MNILQFWLIDSIVKASSAPVVLPSDSARNSSDEHDREPLFAASSDDEEDDAGGRTRYDIENPRPHSRSNSPSRDKRSSNTLSTQEDYKSSGSASSGTPSNQVEHALSMHAYPPSTSTPSSSRPTSTSPKPVHKYKRSPPPPIPIQPLNQPAINSPQPPSGVPRSGMQQPQPRVVDLRKDTIGDDSSQEWASSWEDSDDWANKVGEEEWTGRRMQEKKGVLDVWDSPTVIVGS